jgi:pimeloyl-ACP methyl ester carboxylesterase
MGVESMARKAKFSRRSILSMSGGIVAASALPAQPHAQSQVALRHNSGYLSNPSVYYDVLEPASGATKAPMILVHGGAHTGAAYLQTPDGRPGWAQYFAGMGHKVVLPDWPGVGRSGHVAPDQLTGELVCAGLGNLLQLFDRPAILLTHSMSGPYGWKLLETHGGRIGAVVAVAPGPPGNMMTSPEILSRNGDTVEVKLQPNSPVALKFSVKEPFVSPKGFIENKLIGNGTRFPREQTDRYASSLVPVPARLIYERVNIEGSQLKVSNFSSYKSKPALVIIGTNDPDHTVAVDKPIVDWLNANGAKAEFVLLSDQGISGNGHMMMIESNSDQIAGLVEQWIGRR